MKRISVSMDGRDLFAAAWEATGYFERLRGLTGRDVVTAQYALAFAKCPRIHCYGMKVPIDVAMLDKDGKVLDARTVMPGELGAKCAGAYWALECREGRLAELGVAPGKALSIERREA